MYNGVKMERQKYRSVNVFCPCECALIELETRMVRNTYIYEGGIFYRQFSSWTGICPQTLLGVYYKTLFFAQTPTSFSDALIVFFFFFLILKNEWKTVFLKDVLNRFVLRVQAVSGRIIIMSVECEDKNQTVRL